MSSSFSRSPRRTYRTLSPGPRHSEHYKQRHPYGYYDDEYRKEEKLRMDDDKYGQSKSRHPCGNIPYRSYGKRLPSPSGRRDCGDSVYDYKPYGAYSSVRGDGNRRSQYMPKYSEGIAYKDYQKDSYSQNMPGRYAPDDHRVRESGKERKSPPRSLPESPRFERKRHDDELKHPRIHDEKYSWSSRRGFDDFDRRSTYQKRYPQKDDFRKYEYMSDRPKYTERYNNREPARNEHRKPEHSSHREKRVQWDLTPYMHHYSHREPPARVPNDHYHKRPKFDSEDQDFFDGKSQKVDERKYFAPKSKTSRDSSCFSLGRGRETESEQGKEPGQVAKKDGASSYPSKSDCMLKPCGNKQELSRTEGEKGSMDSSSSNKQDNEKSSISDAKSSSPQVNKSLLIKVDTKMLETSRQSEDIPPGEHLDSTQNTENKPSGEFAQEIITVIHQVKANYFSSPAISLHERFSKRPINRNVYEVSLTSDPEVHRRIDMSLIDRQNRSVVYESEENVVKVIDANDLRHDIERRRRERLMNEDAHTFRINSASKRNGQNFIISTLNTQDDSEPQKSTQYIKSSFRRFIQKSELNDTAQKNDTAAHKPLEDTEKDENSLDSEKVFKSNRRVGKSQPHFKSNLVKKSLFIEAEYQC
ncbi:BCLAF1 and THRAP3 family member 3 [Suncus etruscus]|uniref:BCLAF1 and THRAP3 family member 3 n=1 Tax=Suncus etruscus TaxID=109475 RepID=UPI0021103E17|nr:BCLAF1 and THRAP3 family member 3 [Suncus etruscus]